MHRETDVNYEILSHQGKVSLNTETMQPHLIPLTLIPEFLINLQKSFF